MNTDTYKDQKILILGLGLNRGGLGSARFFAIAGAQVKVTDLKTDGELQPMIDELKEFSNIEYILGQHRNEDIDWADLIIRNQAIKPDNQYLKYAQAQRKRVEMDLGIFLECVPPHQVIGVTGTKGKSTTASLIYAAIKDTYPNSLLAGNIGQSVLDSLARIDEDTIIILELSSFQLEAWQQHQVSPRFAVITNIMPDHLNYYASMEEYIQAKRVIAENQTEADHLFINETDKIVNTPEFLEGIKSHIIKYNGNDLPQDFTPTLPGEHNRANYAAALKVATGIKVPLQHALTSMNTFMGVEFRLQLVKEWQGVKIYNDTASTGPNSTIAAIKTFPNSILICGGQDKGLPFDELAAAIEANCKMVYFLEGTATDKIKELLKDSPKVRNSYADISLLIHDLKQEVHPDDIILFSPGAASFNLFQNEFDRGRKFNQAVAEYFQ